MFWCKRCSGTLYEEEIFWDEDSLKFMQVGCYQCADKLYIEYSKWEAFKKAYAKALTKV